MDIVVRIALDYLFLLFALKTVGRRQLGKMSPFELVLLLLIPEILSPSPNDPCGPSTPHAVDPP